MKNRYENKKPRELPGGAAVHKRPSSSENWQPATVIESEGQIGTLEITHGRVLRRHKDNVRLRTDDPETIIDRKTQKIVEQQGLSEESEIMIASPLNEMAPPLMPRQEAASGLSRQESFTIYRNTVIHLVFKQRLENS